MTRQLVQKGCSMSMTKSKKQTPKWSVLGSPRFAAICGILGPLLGFGSIGVAVALSASWFNWFDHALSDLGNPVMLGGFHGDPGLNLAAPIFNGGMIVTGLLAVFLGLQLVLIQRAQKSRLGVAGGALLMIAMLCLAGVGVFHELLVLGHIMTASGFFFGLMLASISYGVALLRVPASRLLGSVTLVMGIIMLVTLTLMFGGLLPFSGAAIPEIILAVAGFAWVVPLSVQLYLGAGKPRTRMTAKRR
jgi:hypothetical membrane protein